MPELPPGQRAAQSPGRAAVAASRALGKATRSGAMSNEMVVVLNGQAPYRISVGEDGGEVRTCLETGVSAPEGRNQGGQDG